MIAEIAQHRSRLDHLYQQADKLMYQQADKLIDDQEMLAHWSRYLCVLTSGFLETSVRVTPTMLGVRPVLTQPTLLTRSSRTFRARRWVRYLN